MGTTINKKMTNRRENNTTRISKTIRKDSEKEFVPKEDVEGNDSKYVKIGMMTAIKREPITNNNATIWTGFFAEKSMRTS
jgi:hypothetical protein